MICSRKEFIDYAVRAGILSCLELTLGTGLIGTTSTSVEESLKKTRRRIEQLGLTRQHYLVPFEEINDELLKKIYLPKTGFFAVKGSDVTFAFRPDGQSPCFGTISRFFFDLRLTQDGKKPTVKLYFNYSKLGVYEKAQDYLKKEGILGIVITGGKEHLEPILNTNYHQGWTSKA